MASKMQGSARAGFRVPEPEKFYNETWNPEKKFQNPEPSPENFQTRNPVRNSGFRAWSETRNSSEFSWIFFQLKYFFLFIIA